MVERDWLVLWKDDQWPAKHQNRTVLSIDLVYWMAHILDDFIKDILQKVKRENVGLLTTARCAVYLKKIVLYVKEVDSCIKVRRQ